MPDRYDALATQAERLRRGVAAGASRAGTAVRVDVVASLFQARLGGHTAASAVAMALPIATLPAPMRTAVRVNS